MKFISWLLTLAILIVAISFALNNRQSTTISLWPFGVEAVMPLYLLSLGTLFLGLLLGAAIGWVSHLPHRFELRRLRRSITDLRDKVENLRVATPPPPESEEDHLLLEPKRRRFWGMRS